MARSADGEIVDPAVAGVEAALGPAGGAALEGAHGDLLTRRLQGLEHIVALGVGVRLRVVVRERGLLALGVELLALVARGGQRVNIVPLRILLPREEDAEVIAAGL